MSKITSEIPTKDNSKINMNTLHSKWDTSMWNESHFIDYLSRHFHCKREKSDELRKVLQRDRNKKIVANADTDDGIKQMSVYCSICNQIFNADFYLNIHAGLHDTIKQGFTCDVCSSQLPSLLALSHHSAECLGSSSTHECTKCGELCPSIPHLNKHMLTHGTFVVTNNGELPKRNKLPQKKCVKNKFLSKNKKIDRKK